MKIQTVLLIFLMLWCTGFGFATKFSQSSMQKQVNSNSFYLGLGAFLATFFLLLLPAEFWL